MKAVKIKFIQKINHNVLRIITDRPPYYNFTPGESTHLAINNPIWKAKIRPFAFTSIPNQNELEFIIKTYPEHKSVTMQMLSLKPGNELLLGDPFGTISYKGEGVFIAGGTGITPFVSLFKDCISKGIKLNSMLLFANKTKKDIIMETELDYWFEKNVTHVLSEENCEEYANGYITAELISAKCILMQKYFYVCGPPKMVRSIIGILIDLDVDPNKIIREIF